MDAHLSLIIRFFQRGLAPSLLGAVALALAVLWAHLWLVGRVMGALHDGRSPPGMPERVQVRYVREMTPSMPTPRKVAPTSAPKVDKPVTSTRGVADAPDASLDDVPEPENTASAPMPPADAASSPQVAEKTEVPPKEPTLEANEADPPPMPASNPPLPSPRLDGVWPQTTRVRYTAIGYYRGEVRGHATVEWIRQGDRYQLQMEVTLGLGLFSRSAYSRGRIGVEGVQPERYDESTKLPFRGVRTNSVVFEEQSIEFSQSRRAPRVPGVQDTASQFVQLIYLFTSRPELANAGQRIEFPLAFPRGLRGYAYQVKGRELLQTPVGSLDTLHVVPRRLQPTNNDLVAQAWFAPAYRYFPVRIRLTLGEENYVDLLISKPPEVAD